MVARVASISGYPAVTLSLQKKIFFFRKRQH
jgi:hypothetical protein